MSPPRSDWTTSTPSWARYSGDGQQVFIDSGPTAQGNDRRVLDKQHAFLAAGQHLLVHRLLAGPGLAIAHSTQIFDPHHAKL